MAHCRFCNNFFLDLNSAIIHLRSVHAYRIKKKLDCISTECDQKFCCYTEFHNHTNECASIKKMFSSFGSREFKKDQLQSIMQNEYNLKKKNVNAVKINDTFSSNAVHFVQENSYNAVQNVIKEQLFSYQRHKLPHVVINEIISNTENIYQPVIGKVSGIINNDKIDLNQCKNELKTLINSISKPFKNFQTTHKRRKFFLNQVPVPREIILNFRYEKRWNRAKSVYIEKPISNTMAYISIIDTLKFLLENPSFRAYLFKERSHSSNGWYNNTSDGSLFQERYGSEKNPVLRIHLYFDELELCNPLGTKRGYHKMGCTFFTLDNLPQHINSKLDNIFLISLFHSLDLKKFGIDKMMEPLVDDLMLLEEEGIVCTENGELLLAVCVVFSADNLGANQVAGMVESFSSLFYCRHCLLSKDLLKETFEEDKKNLRQSELHENHVKEAEASGKPSFGVVRDSIFNKLKYFSFPKFNSVDIMHDILLEAKVFLKFLISSKIITLERLNERITSYNYGSVHRANKPSVLNLDKLGNSIGQKASQMHTLIIFLPLIVGDLITDQTCSEWRVILLLLKIMSIVFCPKISNQMKDELAHLVKDHHKLFCETYSMNLIPKQHMMTHYAGIIERLGPLKNLWCMRFEAKNNFFKQYAYKVNNFKNITKTLALRHQETVMVPWISKSLDVPLLFPKGISKNIKTIDWGKSFANFLSIPEESMTILEVKWIFYSYEFKKSYVLYTCKESDIPQFFLITTLFIFENEPFARALKLNTLGFSNQYFSYQIEKTDLFQFINLKENFNHPPMEIHQNLTSDTNMYLVPKFYLL